MNVPEIQAFVDTIDPVLSGLIQIRDDLYATDRLWSVLDPTTVLAIRQIIVERMDALKLALAAIQVP